MPSEAQEGYQVSALTYSAWRPVKPMPASVSDWGKGQSGGGVEGQTRTEPAAAASAAGSAAVDGEAVNPKARRRANINGER